MKDYTLYESIDNNDKIILLIYSNRTADNCELNSLYITNGNIFLADKIWKLVDRSDFTIIRRNCELKLKECDLIEEYGNLFISALSQYNIYFKITSIGIFKYKLPFDLRPNVDTIKFKYNKSLIRVGDYSTINSEEDRDNFLQLMTKDEIKWMNGNHPFDFIPGHSYPYYIGLTSNGLTWCDSITNHIYSNYINEI